SHSFSEGPVLSPLTDTLSQSTQVATGTNSHGGVAYTTSNSSIQVSIAPAEDRPSQDPGGVERDSNTVVTPGIFITQTVGYSTSSGSKGVYASANSKFSGDFTGTGNLTNFNVMGYSFFNSSKSFSNLNLIVKNLTTGSNVLKLFLNPTSSKLAFNPVLLDFSTVPGDVYNLNFDLFSSTFPGSFVHGGSITTSFVANTPEPSTILLLVTGLGIVMFARMRHRIGKDMRIN
ncbi:MAG: PEP-CTERM sorting domain-containing protein, partial [Leptospirales bacterium]